MVAIKTFVQLALSLEGTMGKAHFKKRSFRVTKRIFATLDEANSRSVLKLSLTDQSVFCSFDPSIIYPAKGGWGRQGWTVIELQKIKKSMLQEALARAFCNVAPKHLSVKVGK